MPTVEIHSHAVENLRFIRETMERASSFTAVPGQGGMLMGATAAAAAIIASQMDDWLVVWLAEVVVAFLIGTVTTVRKAHRIGIALDSSPARKFVLAFAPPLFTGALLTWALWNAGLVSIIPGMWLCLYGVAIAGAGAYSVPVVPAMGGAFLAFGAVALAAPAEWGNTLLGIAFGGLHIGFGSVIARRYGG